MGSPKLFVGATWEMSSKPAPRVTWSQKLADTTLILPSGETLECHKLVLATHSPIFEEIFSQDKQKSTITVDQFEQATVVSFLEYLYAETFKNGHQPMMKDKFNVQLLRMAHQYGVKKLQEDCTEYLGEKVCDENVMELWTNAEECGNESLHTTVIKHLVERATGRDLEEVPGFTEAFGNYKKPMRELLMAMSAKNTELREKVKEREDVCLQNKERENELESVNNHLTEVNANLMDELQSKNCQVSEKSNEQDDLADVNSKLKAEISALKEELKSQTKMHKEHIRRQYCMLSKHRTPEQS